MTLQTKIRNTALMILSCMFILCSCGSQEIAQVEAPEAEWNFKVYFTDSGKADAIILKTENNCAVIDCGEKGDGDDVLTYLDQIGFSTVDYLFITHFDKDHVGGAPKVINGIDVEEIVIPDYEGNNSEYEKFVEALEENNITPTVLKENMTLTLDDVLLQIYPPMRSSYKESDNDFSLCIGVTHGGNTFLFAGDAEEDRLKELPKQMNMEHIFLKVPHHGRYNDRTETFFESVSPKYAVITCSEKNPADDEVLEILNGMGCQVYQTVDGPVVVLSDGKNLTVSQ